MPSASLRTKQRFQHHGSCFLTTMAEAYGPYALLHLRISAFTHPQLLIAVRN